MPLPDELTKIQKLESKYESHSQQLELVVVKEEIRRLKISRILLHDQLLLLQNQLKEKDDNIHLLKVSQTEIQQALKTSQTLCQNDEKYIKPQERIFARQEV